MDVKLFRKLFHRKLIRRKYSNIECGGMTTISGTNYCLNLGIGNFTMIYLSYDINLDVQQLKPYSILMKIHCPMKNLNFP